MINPVSANNKQANSSPNTEQYSVAVAKYLKVHGWLKVYAYPADACMMQALITSFTSLPSFFVSYYLWGTRQYFVLLVVNSNSNYNFSLCHHTVPSLSVIALHLSSPDTGPGTHSTHSCRPYSFTIYAPNNQQAAFPSFPPSFFLSVSCS